MTSRNPKPPTYSLTREDWLHRAVEELRGMFEQVGATIPERLHISVGFGGGAFESKRVEGVCWHSSRSSDGANHIFISPTVGDTAHVLSVLVHELCHACLDNRDAHRGEFKEIMSKLGMVAPFTDSIPDIALAGILMTIAAVLGEYPHAVLDPTRVKAPVGEQVPVGVGGPTSGPGVQVNRWIVFRCPIEAHDAPIRMSRTRGLAAAPYCGVRDEFGNPCLTECHER